MESMISLGAAVFAIAGAWLWDIVAHREPTRLDRKLRHQLRQSADTIRDSTLR